MTPTDREATCQCAASRVLHERGCPAIFAAVDVTPTDRAREALAEAYRDGIAAANGQGWSAEVRVMRSYEYATARVDALIAAVRAECGADTARVDWLEGEMLRESSAIVLGGPMPRSLFRSNNPITRAAIDAAMRAEASRD